MTWGHDDGAASVRRSRLLIAIIAGGSIAYWATRPIAAARPPAVTTFLFRLRVLI
jgi:hypothetical protein